MMRKQKVNRGYQIFTKALREEVSRTLAWSLEEEKNGCLSSLKELMQIRENVGSKF